MSKKFPERKCKILKMFVEAFATYEQVILVNIMNISTTQIVKTRQTLRKRGGLIIVGKNTIATIALTALTKKQEPGSPLYALQKEYGMKPQLACLIPYMVGKQGFVFSNESYVDLKPILESEIVKSAAKAGTIAPSSIWLRCGNTNQDPGKINEFQNLGISVKAIKGSLEIVKDFQLCKQGDLVTETVSHMCRMLNIIPFEYAMELKFVYRDGSMIPTEVISITNDDLIESLQNTVRNVTSISLGANLINSLSVPHLLTNTFKNLLSIGLSSKYEFKELKDALSAKSSAPTQAPATKTETKQAKVEVASIEEEEENMDIGDMFG